MTMTAHHQTSLRHNGSGSGSVKGAVVVSGGFHVKMSLLLMILLLSLFSSVLPAVNAQAITPTLDVIPTDELLSVVDSYFPFPIAPVPEDLCSIPQNTPNQ